MNCALGNAELLLFDQYFYNPHGYFPLAENVESNVNIKWLLIT